MRLRMLEAGIHLVVRGEPDNARSANMLCSSTIHTFPLYTFLLLVGLSILLLRLSRLCCVLELKLKPNAMFV